MLFNQIGIVGWNKTDRFLIVSHQFGSKVIFMANVILVIFLFVNGIIMIFRKTYYTHNSEQNRWTP